MFSLLFAIASCDSLNDAYAGPYNRIVRGGSNFVIFRFASYNVPNLLLMEGRNSVAYPTLYNIPVCQAKVVSKAADSQGYVYGVENKLSCIVPKSTDTITYNYDDGWQIPTVGEQEDPIMSVRGSQGRVIRTYTLGFGQHLHVSAPNTFYEPAWVAFDTALYLARKHGIRLIIPLINNHNGDDSSGATGFGDYSYMAAFRGLAPSQFYGSSVMMQDMKDIIFYMLNRVNTLTGIAYKNDPAILAWELGNELGGWSGPSPPYTWTIGLADYIKSIAPDNLVMDGSFGALTSSSRYLPEVLASGNVDMFSNHYYYGYSDLARAQGDVSLVTSYNKVFMIGEFGFDFTVCQELYALALSDTRFTGALIWALRGGFYTHSEGNNYWSYHVSGFPSANGFSSDDLLMPTMIRGYSLAMQGLSPSTPLLTTGYGYPIADSSVTPTALRWVGSAWAAQYQIFRRSSATAFSSNAWRLVTSVVKDNVQTGNSIYSDYTTVSGLYYWYLIQPVGMDGVVDNLAALQIGPFLA